VVADGDGLGDAEACGVVGSGCPGVFGEWGVGTGLGGGVHRQLGAGFGVGAPPVGVAVAPPSDTG
jgi:hypothetical protein